MQLQRVRLEGRHGLSSVRWEDSTVRREEQLFPGPEDENIVYGVEVAEEEKIRRNGKGRGTLDPAAGVRHLYSLSSDALTEPRP